jgi:hypothetical protein
VTQVEGDEAGLVRFSRDWEEHLGAAVGVETSRVVVVGVVTP